MHLATFVQRNIFADHETFVRKVIADLVGNAAFAVVIVECPAAAGPVNQVPMLVLLIGPLADHAAGVAMFAPHCCIDAVIRIERRHDDVLSPGSCEAREPSLAFSQEQKCSGRPE